MKVTITITDGPATARVKASAQPNGHEDTDESTALALAHIIHAALRLAHNAARGDADAVALVNRIGTYLGPAGDKLPNGAALN